MSTRFGLVFLIWGAGLGAAGQYGKVSVIYDQLGGIYPGAGAALGFLVSIVGFVGIVFGVFAGILVARAGFARALVWALWGGAAVSVLQAFLPPLWLMLTLRALEGVSHLAIVVSAPPLIAQLSAMKDRGLTMTLWSTFFGVAYTLLVWLGLPMVANLGIASLFWVHALWMAVFAASLGLLLRGTGSPVPGAPLSLPRLLSDHGNIYRSPFISAPGFGWLFYTFCFLALLTLLPPYIDESQRAFVLGAMPLVSIIVSMTLGVVLLRRFSAITLVVTGFVIVLAALGCLLITPGGAVACLVLAGALGLVQGASFAAVPQLNADPAHQAQGAGAMAQMGNLGNTLGTPALAAVIAGAGYNGMIFVSLAVIAAGIMAHLYLAHRRMFA